MELVVHILAPLAFLMNILFQIFLVRYQKSSLLKSELAAFIFGFISLVVMSILFWQPHQPLANTLYFVLNTLIYTCLGYVFFHFINLVTLSFVVFLSLVVVFVFGATSPMQSCLASRKSVRVARRTR